MTKYKCVKALVLEVVDGDGSFIENEHFVVRVGSVWEREEGSYRMISTPESNRLTDSDGRWMEIYSLNEHFIKLV
ncbi:hypothetical protein [Sporosarcina sp. FA9]|uniref:hypothetical protein n=1 Tax=Sporosarcina sp. FA9 TaxID=3413030 RepID=UPI003F6601D5